MKIKTIAFRNLLTLFFVAMLASCSNEQHYYLFVGTYTNTSSKGIYVYDFNAATGDATLVSNTDSVTNPSWVSVSGDRKFVYAVNETNGANPGRVSAYSFDRANGTLKFINTTASGGDDPCYLATTSDNKWLTVANYSSGTAAVIPINEDGSLKPYSQLIHDTIYRDSGSTATPHVHETVFSPDEKYLVTPDLGLDKLIIYRFDKTKDQPLTLSTPSFVESKKGSGPRHMVFSPNKKFAYLMHELSGTVTTYQYADGKFTEIQDLPTFPEGTTGRKDGAEINISPDGKFLYTSDRADLNIITVFSIDATTGKLAFKGTQSSLGQHPRHFMIDPGGNFLLAANQDSESIIIFKRDKETGMLSETGKTIHVPRPVCLQMIPK
jgi:6-phosphogluconolactonase